MDSSETAGKGEIPRDRGFRGYRKGIPKLGCAIQGAGGAVTKDYMRNVS